LVISLGPRLDPWLDPGRDLYADQEVASPAACSPAKMTA
jgi:hypothetical protein